LVMALAAATNAGSAATLIGNPQNIVIASLGRLEFWTFLTIGAVPAIFTLVVVFFVVWLQWQSRVTRATQDDKTAASPITVHPLDRNQTIKGAVALLALLVLFATPLPRETGALIIAALLLASRKITSRRMIAAVDWPLLLLVACLFGITGALNHVGIAAQIFDFLTEHGLLPGNLLLLTPYSLLASNTIGGVPGAMLFLELWPSAPTGVFYSLALLSGLAGNLLLTGSLTNVLIAERADQMGARLSFAEHARAGVPIALLSLGFAVFWLALTHTLPTLPER
jgi:Na+/H+ antiporter NhaD/arsenite permease-like protein